MYIDLDYNKKVDQIGWGDQECLIEKAKRAQEHLPPSQRTNVFCISCPCEKCNPYVM